MTAPVPLTDSRVEALAQEIAKGRTARLGWPEWEHLSEGSKASCRLQARHELGRIDEMEAGL